MKKSTLQTCLEQGIVLEYLHGKLSEEETYQVESHLMDCLECNQAIEYFACTHTATNPAHQIPHTNATVR